MCPQSRRKKSGHMSFALFQKIIDETAHHIYDIKLNIGGEPTLHPQHHEFIQYAVNKGVKVEMHTNGTTLTKQKSINIVRSGLNVLSFSLDVFDPQKYELSRIGGNFEKTLSNIKTFLEIKKETGTSVYTIVQLIQFPEESLKEKIVEKNNISQFFNSLPLDEIKIIKMHNFGGKISATNFDQSNQHPCGDIYHAMNIKWDGNVVPCCLDLLDEQVMGNINNNELLEIWNNTQYERLRDTLNRGLAKTIPLCSNCESAYCNMPLRIPNNLLGMGRSIIGRNCFVASLENIARRSLLLKRAG